MERSVRTCTMGWVTNENLIFCDKSIEKSQTKVSKEGHGLINLWKDLGRLNFKISNNLSIRRQLMTQ